jgi:hypothetical protein
MHLTYPERIQLANLSEALIKRLQPGVDGGGFAGLIREGD